MASGRRWPLFGGFLCVALLAGMGSAPADPLPPQTRIRLSVVQWNPARGDYARWDAVSGDYVVSANETILLPLIGTLETKGLDEAALATEIEARLKDKVGLVALPDARVEIADYPPFYVLGSVAQPGAFPFRPGIDALQAVAVAGGLYRAQGETGASDQIGRLGDLRTMKDDILRMRGRLARLQAERAGDKDITFPFELTDGSGGPLADEIQAQERLIFTTRASGLERQLTTLDELKTLFAAEIDVLGQKGRALERALETMRRDLTNVERLVEQGVATAGRRSDLERAISSLDAERLDQVTATMRARQSLNQATRDGLSLRDMRATDIASDLQSVQADIQRLQTRRDVVERLLLASAVEPRASEAEGQAPTLRYVVVRKSVDGTQEIAADEATALQPGDVLKVDLVRSAGGNGRGSGPVARRADPPREVPGARAEASLGGPTLSAPGGETQAVSGPETGAEGSSKTDRPPARVSAGLAP